MIPGLYTHIPFCRRKCIYCAFYSVAGFTPECADAYRAAIIREAAYFQERYFSSKPVRVGTWYIGGGTPSLLPVSFYAALCEELGRYIDFSFVEEVTFEANPEHLTYDYLKDLYRYTPVRRLSIGVQSFSDRDLKFLHRFHSGKDAVAAVENARRAGFENLSIDLIYGLWPVGSSASWTDNLERLASLDLPHFSAYALTVEPRTALALKLDKNQVEIADELQIERDYRCLQAFVEDSGYEAYEISNYARPGRYALHNSNYWRDVPYIGLGASAHSYIGRERHWNVSRIGGYMDDPVSGKQREWLSDEDRYHEYVMTALRTQWGVCREKIAEFPVAVQDAFYRQAEKEVAAGNLLQKADAYIVPKGKRLLTDGIASSFF